MHFIRVHEATWAGVDGAGGNLTASGEAQWLGLAWRGVSLSE